MVKPKVENETKEERFKRIAETRTRRILNDLRLLSNCSNKNIYTYSEGQIEKIFLTIKNEFERTKTLFLKDKNKKFSLD